MAVIIRRRPCIRGPRGPSDGDGRRATIDHGAWALGAWPMTHVASLTDVLRASRMNGTLVRMIPYPYPSTLYPYRTLIADPQFLMTNPLHRHRSEIRDGSPMQAPMEFDARDGGGRRALCHVTK